MTKIQKLIDKNFNSVDMALLPQKSRVWPEEDWRIYSAIPRKVGGYFYEMWTNSIIGGKLVDKDSNHLGDVVRDGHIYDAKAVKHGFWCTLVLSQLHEYLQALDEGRYAHANYVFFRRINDYAINDLQGQPNMVFSKMNPATTHATIVPAQVIGALTKINNEKLAKMSHFGGDDIIDISATYLNELCFNPEYALEQVSLRGKFERYWFKPVQLAYERTDWLPLTWITL